MQYSIVGRRAAPSVSRQPSSYGSRSVIVTAGGVVLAAKQATSVIPIVFAVATDPVGGGLVASLARPGGNVTGLSLQFTDTVGKRLDLLREVIPDLRRLAVMGNVRYPAAVVEMREVQTAGRTFGLDAIPLEIQRAEDIAPAVEGIKGRADALYVAADPLATSNRSWRGSADDEWCPRIR